MTAPVHERIVTEYRFVCPKESSDAPVVVVNIRDDLRLDVTEDGQVIGVEKVGQLLHIHDLLDVLGAVRLGPMAEMAA